MKRIKEITDDETQKRAKETVSELSLYTEAILKNARKIKQGLQKEELYIEGMDIVNILKEFGNIYLERRFDREEFFKEEIRWLLRIVVIYVLAFGLVTYVLMRLG